MTLSCLPVATCTLLATQCLTLLSNFDTAGRLVQPQECITTTKLKSADNAAVKFNVMDQDPLPSNVIMILIFPQGLWTSSLTIASQKLVRMLYA